MSRPSLVAAALLAPLFVQAQPLDVQQLTLANGMVWLVVEQHDAPVFTGYVRVRAGGLDEEQGATGLAHLFEHLAFKGSPVLGTSDWPKERALLDELARVGDELTTLERSGQRGGARATELRARLAQLTAQHRDVADENALLRLYRVNGGTGLNATTDKDVTSYFVSLPKNRLELWLLTEAQRLAAPVLRDFYAERAVVEEERRSSIDANPAGLVYEELNQLAFVGSPYRWPTIGYEADLRGMTVARAHAFFERHYAPANAVGCIVGDVTLAQVQPLLERTFGLIPPRPRPAPPVFAEPPQRGPRRSVVRFDAGPRLMLAFRGPAAGSRGERVLEVVMQVLAQGNSARLTQRLVFQDRLAQSVRVFAGPGWRLDSLLVISALPMAGVSTAQLERAIWKELDRLKTEPVAPRELQKAKNQLAAERARLRASNRTLASVLSIYQALYGDWRVWLDWQRDVESVTAEDVMASAATLLTPERSSTVELERGGAP